MDQTRNIAESPEYRKIRDELLLAEVDLRHRRERVAELRRTLPMENLVDDYEFEEGPADLSSDELVRRVKLSELFTAPDRTLFVYHYMFGKKQESACPMCTMWIDGFNAVVQHISQRVDVAIVAAPPLGDLRAWARSRNWTNLRLLTDAGTFKYDFHSEDAEGNQDSTVSVFRLGDDGTVRHFYTGHPWLPQGEWRGIDLLTPVWHLFDLTPEGRGEWWPELSYQT